ncbi:MAG: hypothetical protein KDD55_10830, partial [Bdellovibrionales bacterium]|nr:hypothetical protein [Bdellovibrionales bacterium]
KTECNSEEPELALEYRTKEQLFRLVPRISHNSSYTPEKSTPYTRSQTTVHPTPQNHPPFMVTPNPLLI